MKLDYNEARLLCSSFLENFPIERLNALSLEEYTNLERNNSFCYWLETKTESLGSIWGGSAYKFGIFRYANQLKDSQKAMHDDKYAWYSKYGDNANSVFDKIKKIIIEIAHCAKNHQFERINEIDLGTAYKWKIAFLYSDMGLLHIYNEKALRYLAKKYDCSEYKTATISDLQKYLIKKSSGENLFVFSEKLWDEWTASAEYQDLVLKKSKKNEDILDGDDFIGITQKTNVDSYQNRYKKSLLAKSFVILAGNSGTGKTRIALKFAEHYSVNIPDYNKSLKGLFQYILGHDYDMNGVKLKSVSDTAVEVYNTKNKYICISFGIIQEYVDWYDEHGTANNPDRSDMQEQGKYDGQSYSWDTTHIEKIAKYVLDYKKQERKGVYIPNPLLIPVGADWTDNTKILGYYNPLANNGAGEYVKTDVLRFIETAGANPDIPFFLILDEMNLSHVERYFSDFLSKMELLDFKSEKKVFFDIQGYGQLELPKNLFITGTVNIDETTYMFSPKVLDRANVIEFKPEKDDVLNNLFSDTSGGEQQPAEPGVAEGFMQLANEVRSGEIPDEVSTLLAEMKPILEAVYIELAKYGFEFAYRTAKEIRLYAVAAYKTAEDEEKPTAKDIADIQILQKILPKIHGNRKQIGDLLENLEKLATENNLTESLKKIRQMKERLNQFQYASFI